MRLSRGIALLAVTLATPMAFAQPDPDPNAGTGEPAPPPSPPPDPTMSPPPPPPPNPGTGVDATPATVSPGTILPNMLPTRYGATVDFRGDYSHFGGDGGLFGDTFLSFDLYGSYIWPENYGAYVQLPYYYASGGDQDSQQGVGNIEIGGLYKLPSGPNSEVLARGGIALDSSGQIDSLLSAFGHLAPRLYDAYPTGLLSYWVRGEGSFRHSEGNLRLGLSVGLDVPFAGSDDFSLNLDALAKIAVSIGFEQPNGTGFAIGYVMMQALGTDGDSDDNNISGLNATVSFPATPTMAVYGSFGLPDLENNIDQFDIWSVGAGLRAAIN